MDKSDKASYRADPLKKGKISRRGMLKATRNAGMGMFLLPAVGDVFPRVRSSTSEGTLPGASPKISNASPGLRILSRTEYETQLRADATPPPWYCALYAEPTGNRLVNVKSPGWISEDNGCTWTQHALKPDFTEGLPYGYRRNPVTSVVDPTTGRLFTLVNSLDTPGLDPDQIEPPVAQYTYYLRYRVSTDGGRSWAFEEPIVGEGDFTPKHPFDGIYIGKSAFYIGDRGSKPIVNRDGKILVPCQTTPLNPDRTPYNPGDALTYTDVLILIGTWSDNDRLTWKASQRVKGDPDRSTRGMIEPTLAELADGRIMMVMRGSNGHGADPDHKLPSYKWFSVSENGGKNWSDPKPWTYNDGETFFSPSSMSSLVTHSSGRIFWIGNMSDENCRANLPRWPLVMGEVDRKSLTLIRDSVLTVDTRTPSDEDRGRLDLSHVTIVEDRANGEFVLSYPRGYDGYKFYQYCTLRIALA